MPRHPSVASRPGVGEPGLASRPHAEHDLGAVTDAGQQRAPLPVWSQAGVWRATRRTPWTFSTRDAPRMEARHQVIGTHAC